MRPDPSDIIQSGATVSDNIRALDRAGYRRSEIAALLGKRYQHVRNVLVDDQARARVAVAGSHSGVAESGQPFEAMLAAMQQPETHSMWLDVDADGRLIIPPALRENLGVATGGKILFKRGADGVWTLSSVEQAIKRMQEIFAPYAKPGVSLVDELIAERRAEAERESRDD